MTLEKTFNFQENEQKIYQELEDSGAFACQPDSGKEPYTIMMPPPNVTGSLHIGHALNHTLQDVLTRYHRMQGHDTLWQPGTDHASIAVHMVLEKQLLEQGKTRQDIGHDEFMKMAWAWREKSGSTILNQLRHLGTTPDWSRERFTMDEGLCKAVTKAFVKLYKDGIIYRSERLVNWDTVRQTGISDMEVEHREVKGKMYYFHYPYEDGSGTVTIATTRPETILADGAVAVHPDDERYKDLVGKFVVVPVVDRIIPVIADEYVKPEFGTGCVKITAAHDFNDFEVYQRHKDKGIPLINLMNPDGTMNENCPEEYVGLDRFEARKKVVADFEELEYLVKIEDHVHPVPYGDRSGTVIEPYLTQQWWCDTPTLAKPAAEAVRAGKTEFVPKQWENTYFAWADNQLPWCISRQLWWGHQIPAWYGPDKNNLEQDAVFVAESEEEAYAEARNYYGHDDFELRREKDILDTWFSSALWPFSTLGWPDRTPELERYYPGNTLVTGFDIIPFWVLRMMMMGIYFMGEAPFEKIYIHALVRDGKGQKMSKSKGNVIDPLDVIEKYGTDALRFTLIAMAAQGRDIRLSEQRIEGYRNFVTKLWNAARYCEMNGCTPPEEFDVQSVQLPLNQWIIAECSSAISAMEKEVADLRFNELANAAYQFVWNTFCDWYLEFTKPLLNSDDTPADVLAETKATTGFVLQKIITFLNPLMPFVTEELNSKLNDGAKHLLLDDWPSFEFQHKEATQEISWLTDLITEIRSVRADMNVPASERITLLVKNASDLTKKRLGLYLPQIQMLCRVAEIDYTEEAPKGAIQTVLGEATLILPIADIIDLDQERARLNNTIHKLEQELNRIEKKLANKDFVSKAPDEVVQEQRDRAVEIQTTLTKFSNALKQLEAA